MKYTETITLKISKEQKETLNKLKIKKVRVSHFIRLAISEKIKRDFKKEIKEKNSRETLLIEMNNFLKIPTNL